MSTTDPDAPQPVVVVKKRKRAEHAHHGGAWKVAYADFVTAMMAFFLLLWLLAAASQEEKQAIQGYFQDPRGSIAGQGGGLDAPGVGEVGSGGANAAAIALNSPLSQSEPARLDKASDTDHAVASAEREERSLDALQRALEAELRKDDSAFLTLRDQIIIDRTALGLRIQIVDKKNRPMFDLGSALLQAYATEVLHALAPRLDEVPNRISIDGHTDSLPFGEDAGYSNWELSADRANTARRALIAGGYPEHKVLTVQGFGPSAPRVEEDPEDPSNRRIVIMVLKKEVEAALRGGSSLTDRQFIDASGPEPLSPGR